MDEAVHHPHNVQRGTFVQRGGAWQPAPSPRLSRTPAAIAGPPSRPGADTEAVLGDWGFPAERIGALLKNGVIQQAGCTGGVDQEVGA
jgi:alpha-methylacyl-CoA racemase